MTCFRSNDDSACSMSDWSCQLRFKRIYSNGTTRSKVAELVRRSNCLAAASNESFRRRSVEFHAADII